EAVGAVERRECAPLLGEIPLAGKADYWILHAQSGRLHYERASDVHVVADRLVEVLIFGRTDIDRQDAVQRSREKAPWAKAVKAAPHVKAGPLTHRVGQCLPTTSVE